VAEIIAVRTSFRRRSNSTALLEEARRAALAAGAEVEVVDLPGKRIAPCRACDACMKDGRCVWKDDDFLPLLDKLWEADRVLVATPVYYMAVPAQLKLLIDRTQCLYNRKYVLKDILPQERLARRRGGVIAVCGSRFPSAFEGLDLTMRFFFDSLQMQWPDGPEGRLYVRHVDKPGEIERHPESYRDPIERARELGRRLAAD
jgi:arsenate reductase